MNKPNPNFGSHLTEALRLLYGNQPVSDAEIADLAVALDLPQYIPEAPELPFTKDDNDA